MNKILVKVTSEMVYMLKGNFAITLLDDVILNMISAKSHNLTLVILPSGCKLCENSFFLVLPELSDECHFQGTLPLTKLHHLLGPPVRKLKVTGFSRRARSLAD